MDLEKNYESNCPVVKEDAFICPHCNAFAQQTWLSCDWNLDTQPILKKRDIDIGHCRCCNNRTIWVYDKMVFPECSGAPLPNNDSKRKFLRHIA